MAVRKGRAPGEGLGGQGSEAIIEFQTIGHSVKVTAMDPITLIEVSIVAPTSASERDMTESAVRKLRHVLARGGR